MNRQPQICLHDFIPGTIQKIAFDQDYNKNVAMVYRILGSQGFIYRARTYTLSELTCDNQDDIEEIMDEAQNSEFRRVIKFW